MGGCAFLLSGIWIPREVNCPYTLPTTVELLPYQMTGGEIGALTLTLVFPF